jgi:DNA-binding MarR family transcriptional regulator
LLLDLFRDEKYGAGEGLQPSDLSELQGTCRNTVSALIASLEKDGLISRELHRTDRRKFVIRLTPQGHRVVKPKLASQLVFVTDCFRAFSPSERQNLLHLLTRLNQSLSAKESSHKADAGSQHNGHARSRPSNTSSAIA